MTRLGPYALLDLAGRGATSHVWRARHDDGEPVALKVLRADVARQPTVRRALAREVRHLARLDHPGVVRVFDHGVVGEADGEASGGDLPVGSPWIALEWVSERDLRRHRASEPAAFHDLVCRLLDALAHAHARGLLHRDLKPSNVLLRAEGDADLPVLTDLGIAAALEAPEPALPGACTPAYAPREQIEGRWSAVGPWTDLHALGVTLRRVRPPGLPEAFGAWLDRLTAAAPFDRFVSAAEALAALPGDRPRARGIRALPRRLTLASLPLHELRVPPLVGLEDARATLAEAFARTLRGEAVRVRIEGPAGSGRTALLRWAAEHAAARGALVVPLDDDPWRALRRLLRVEGGAPPGEPWASLLGPALVEDLGAALRSEDPRAGPRLLAATLAHLRSRWPVVVTADGAPETRAVLRALGRFGVAALVLWVDDEPGGEDRVVRLPAPTPAELAQVVEAHVPLHRPDSLRLAHAAAGRATEAVRALWSAVAGGRVRLEGGRWSLADDEPEGGAEPAPAALCVIGALAPWLGPEHVPLVAAACGERIGEIERSFEDGRLVVDGGRLVVDRPPPRSAWPAGVDAACLEVLDALTGDPLLDAVRAEHLFALGRADEASERWLAAAQALNLAGRHDRVLDVVRRARDRCPAPERRIRLRYLEALALGHTGSVAQAVEACRAVADWGRENGHPTMAVMAAVELVFWLHRAGRTEEARALARDAVEAARGTVTEGSAWLHLLHVLPANAWAEAEAAEAAGHRAATSRPALRCDLWFSAAIRLRGRGDDEGAAERVRRILAAPEASAEQRMQAHSMLGELGRARGDLAEAEHHLRAAVDGVGRDADPALYVLVRVNLALVLMDAGRLVEARRWLAPLLEHYDPAAAVAAPVVELVLAGLSAAEGELSEASARLERVERDRDRRILHQPDSLDVLARIVAGAEGRQPELAARAQALATEFRARLG